MVLTASYTNPKNLDLRAPSLTKIRKGITIDSLRILALLSSDCFFLALAWQFTRQLSHAESYLWIGQRGLLDTLLICAIHIWFIAAHGLYGADAKRRDYASLIKAIGLAHISVILFAYLAQPNVVVSALTFVVGLGVSSVLACGGRWLINKVIAYMRQSGAGCYSSLIICTADTIDQSVRTLQGQKRYQITGWVDASVLVDDGGWDATLAHISQLGISEVFLSSSVSIQNPVFLYWSLRNAGIKLHILPTDVELPVRQFELFRPGRLPGLTFSPPLITGSDFWLKRSFDFCAALGLLILLSPILLLIALLIKLDSPGPIFFKQTRMGLKNQEFKAWKFRTMVVNAEQLQKQLEAQNETKDGVLFKIKSDPRITRVGTFLRQYSLDELPQLFNVLFGDMSLVGPRPLPMRDIEKFDSHHFVRHEVLPGITGLWQVSGRSDIVDFEDVVRLDLRYIENWSLWLDINILFRTVKVVLQKTGAY